MSGLTIDRGQRNIINLPVAMPFPGAIDWSTSWLQFEMTVPQSPPDVVVRKSARTTPNDIVLLHDDLVRITLEPADTADVPLNVAELDWNLQLHLGDFNVYVLDAGPTWLDAGAGRPNASG